MSKEKSLLSSPQLDFVEHGAAVALTEKQVISLFKKSQQSGIPFDTLKEVYVRGYLIDFSEQTAYNRINSFIAGGLAAQMDQDLLEKRGLWDNIHAKRERIKRGSGEHMRKPGEKGRPTAQDFKNSQEEAYTAGEPQSSDPNDPSSRFVGTDSLTNVFKASTPGQSKTLKTIKRVVKEAHQCKCSGKCGCGKEVEEAAIDAKGHKSSTGGLTQKGRDYYNRKSGGHLKAPVTTEPSKLKKGSKAANRRKSFCARMGGMKKRLTSAKTANDPDSRINKALRKWNC